MIKSNKLIILTGAGFTKNFNGFLATEMWSKIFNDPRIQQNKKLKELLQSDQDYESIYHKILNGPEYSYDEKTTLKEVVESVYKKLDDSVRAWNFNDGNPAALDTYKLYSELFGLLNNGVLESGLFFTLNQDIFVERWWGWRSPGVPYFDQNFYATHGAEFTKEDYRQLPSDDIENAITKYFENNYGIVYIKLHGSFGWKSSNGENQMVIGKNKKADIENEPILKEYFKIFENAIKEGYKKLLIIGYGFGDAHINKIILEGVEKYNLKLYIISPKTPEEFRKQMEGRPNNESTLWAPSENSKIWKAISGYFPYTLREIFPPNQEGSTHIQEIKTSLLN